MNSTVCQTAYISGVVQGVGYRAFARRAAIANQVTGWARNLPDGRVEVRMCGAPDAVAALLAELQRGPRWSQVTDLAVHNAVCEEIHGFTTG